MPLKFSFKKMFEKENNLQNILTRLSQKGDSNIMSDFIDGALWKQKMEGCKGDIVIPFYLYVDDLEINNPLGAKATSDQIAVIYFSFPNLNSHKLDSIFLAGIIKTNDMKQFGNDVCLRSLVTEIKFLEEEGLTLFALSPKPIKVKFMLALILGDNLGVNSLLDFSKSFSANYYCRFCTDSKQICQHLSQENAATMRNIEKYNNDLKKNDFKQTGVRKKSVLNDIKSFHVVNNFAVDVMHDIFEGICHYDIAHILLYYIYECKLFTLEELNICKNNFNYGQIEIGNMSPPIKFEEHLQKKKFKMSARQMMTFTHFLPLMIGHFIPKNDEVWAFFLGLLKIIDIIMSFKISKSEIILLRLLIKEHNEQFTRLFKDTLKPKFHLLVHYPTVIEHSGPPRKFWCFRYESKHKEFKIYAHAITSRKNICLTLAKKNQMKFASFLLENHAEFQVENCNKITSNFSDFISNQLGTVTDEFTSY